MKKKSYADLLRATLSKVETSAGEASQKGLVSCENVSLDVSNIDAKILISRIMDILKTMFD